AVLRKALDVEAVARDREAALVFRGPDEDVDQMLPALVREHRDALAAHVIEPAAGELETLGREIGHGRGKRQPRGQPGLDGVLVRRGYVEGAAGERRSHVAREYLPGEALVLSRPHRRDRDQARERDGAGESGRGGQPAR